MKRWKARRPRRPRLAPPPTRQTQALAQLCTIDLLVLRLPRGKQSRWRSTASGTSGRARFLPPPRWMPLILRFYKRGHIIYSARVVSMSFLPVYYAVILPEFNLPQCPVVQSEATRNMLGIRSLRYSVLARENTEQGESGWTLSVRPCVATIAVRTMADVRGSLESTSSQGCMQCRQ